MTHLFIINPAAGSKNRTEAYREKMAEFIPDDLKNKIHYINNDCRDIWAWSDKVYAYVKAL